MHIRLSASTRLILAVLHLSADIAEGFGKAVIDILQKQYPEMKQELAEDPAYAENAAASIGHKLVAIARKQLQYNEQDAYDAIQDLLVYLTSSKFDFKAKSKKGNPGAKNWRQALNNVYTNLRGRAMSRSFKKFKKGKATDEEIYADMLWRRNQVINENPRYSWEDEDDDELNSLGAELVKGGVDIKSIVPTKMRRKNIRDKSIDEAFGKRGEGGGAPEGGEARLPDEGMAVDDKAAQKSFLEALDPIVPDLIRSLPLTADGLPAQRFLFNFLYEEEDSGAFSAGIDSNMKKATMFRNYLEEISMRQGPRSDEAKAILKRYGNRWSGFVGDTRTRLLKSIQDFVEEYLPDHEYEQLWDEFFSDTSPKKVEDIQIRKDLKQMSDQRGKDLRKLIRMQERDKLGLLNEKEKQGINSLRKRLQKEISQEYRDREIEWDAYMKKRSEFTDLPPGKQPKLKRPSAPLKKPATLDEQLKAAMIEFGESIRNEVEEEFKLMLENEEKIGKEAELAESIADEANVEVDAKHGVASFFRRFLPDWA